MKKLLTMTMLMYLFSTSSLFSQDVNVRENGYDNPQKEFNYFDYMEQQEQGNRKPVTYSSTGSIFSGELLSGIDFQALLRPKDDRYGLRITGDTPYCNWIMVILGVEGEYFKGSNEDKSGVAYLGIGPGIRYKIGSFFFSANLFPYAGYKREFLSHP